MEVTGVFSSWETLATKSRRSSPAVCGGDVWITSSRRCGLGSHRGARCRDVQVTRLAAGRGARPRPWLAASRWNSRRLIKLVEIDAADDLRAANGLRPGPASIPSRRAAAPSCGGGACRCRWPGRLPPCSERMAFGPFRCRTTVASLSSRPSVAIWSSVSARPPTSCELAVKRRCVRSPRANHSASRPNLSSSGLTAAVGDDQAGGGQQHSQQETGREDAAEHLPQCAVDRLQRNPRPHDTERLIVVADPDGHVAHRLVHRLGCRGRETPHVLALVQDLLDPRAAWRGCPSPAAIAPSRPRPCRPPESPSAGSNCDCRGPCRGRRSRHISRSPGGERSGPWPRRALDSRSLLCGRGRSGGARARRSSPPPPAPILAIRSVAG